MLQKKYAKCVVRCDLWWWLELISLSVRLSTLLHVPKFFPPLSPIFPMFSIFSTFFPASPSFVCLSPIFPAYSRFIFQFSHHFPSLFYLYPIVCCIFSHVFLNFSWCFFHPAGGPGDFDPGHPDGSHLRRLRGGLPGGGSRELRPDQSGWELRVSGAPLSLGGMTDVFSLCRWYYLCIYIYIVCIYIYRVYIYSIVQMYCIYINTT